MDYKAGYDFKTVDSEDNLECPICLMLLRETMGIPCSHLLCKACLEKLKTSSVFGRRCPTCKKTIDFTKVHPNFYVDRLVTGSNVYCSQKDEGCEWVGTLNSYLQKHDDECGFKDIPCNIDGCMELIMRNMVHNHKAVCKFRELACKYCGDLIKFNQIKDHNGNVCQRIPVACVMLGCLELVPREQMENHLKDICEFVKVDCQFAQVGCNEKVYRNCLEDHNVKFAHAHMVHMCSKLSQTEQKAEKQDQTIKQIQLENDQSKDRIAQMQLENDQSKDRIERLRIENDKSKGMLKQSNDRIERLECENNQSKDRIQQLEDQLKTKTPPIASSPTHCLQAIAAAPKPEVNTPRMSILSEGLSIFMLKSSEQYMNYRRWYEEVDSMILSKLYCANDFIFFKVRLLRPDVNSRRGRCFVSLNEMDYSNQSLTIDGNDIRVHSNVSIYLERRGTSRCFRVNRDECCELKKSLQHFCFSLKVPSPRSVDIVLAMLF